METRVPILSRRNRLLLATFLGALFPSASSSAAEPTKNECIAANESAQDLRQAGKLLEARQKLTICVAASCPRTLREDCAQRLTEIDKAMPTLVLVAKDSVGKDLSAVHVTMDGEQLAEKLDGRPIAVDPGERSFTFEAVGLRTMDRTFVVREGEKNREERVVLGAIVSSLPPASAEAPQRGLLASVPTPSYAAFGVGVVGLAIGTIAGVVAIGDHSTLKNQCTSYCPPGQVGAFHTAADVSTVGFVVGALGVVAGAVFWVTLRKESPDVPAARAWVSPGSVGVAGSF